jgi:hypothetical protein
VVPSAEVTLGWLGRLALVVSSVRLMDRSTLGCLPMRSSIATYKWDFYELLPENARMT